MVGSPGRKVAAKDQLTGFNVQVAPELSEATKLERDLASVRQQRSAAEAGMLQSAAAEDAAAAFMRQREQAQLDVARIRDEERERDRIVGGRMRALDMQLEELRDAREGASNPDAYWEDKGDFAKTLATIGMALYAAGGAVTGADPLGLAKEIRARADAYNQAKRLEVELIGQEIAQGRTQLDDVRRQFISPDAADAATRALMLESAAAETSAQAQYYKSAESQGAASQLIATLRKQAADERAAAELAEQDAVTQSWKHVPAHVAGGSPGGLAGLMARARKLNITDPAEALRAAQSGILPYSKNEMELAKLELQQMGSRGHMQRRSDVEKGTVMLPEGGTAYHPSETEARGLETAIHSIPPWQTVLKKMKAIHEKSLTSTGAKLSSDDRANLQVLAAEAASYVKPVAANEALTSGEDQELWSKLRGGNTNDLFRLASDVTSLDAALAATERYNRRARGRLRQVPEDYTGPKPRPYTPPVEGARDQ